MSPSWDVAIECGAWGVVEANVAVIPPDGGANPALSLGCAAAPAGGQCATLDALSSNAAGLGLVSPAGVRDDAFYVHLEGNGVGGQLCQPNEVFAKFGELTTDAIVGSSVVAAGLGEEGVESPGLGLNLAEDAAGPIPITEIKLITGDPIPKLSLELGPAIVTAGSTRWDILLTQPTELVHRVAFGLVAPFGTTTADMSFIGCTVGTGEPEEVRTCTSTVAPTVDANRSWTVGPVDFASSPAGLKEHTMYVVLEGDFAFGSTSTTLNLPGQTVILGTVVLTGTPDLEPALILEGVD